MTSLPLLLSLRPLPIRVRPYPGETLTSYVRRIESVHQLPDGAIPAARKRSGVSWAEYLAVAVGMTGHSLSHALPELRDCGDLTDPHPDGHGIAANSQGSACRSCAAAKGILTSVRIWSTHERVLCRKHIRWIGGTKHNAQLQPMLTGFTDILNAHRAHLKLLTRQDRSSVHAAFLDADDIICSWSQEGKLPIVSKRLALLQERTPVPGAKGLAGAIQLAPAAQYPETVSLTRLFLDTVWREELCSRYHTTRQRALQQLSKHVTCGYRPTSRGDPLLRWVAEEQITESGSDSRSSRHLVPELTV